MTSEFDKIVKNIDYDHYFDQENWYKNVLKTSYDIVSKDGFAIIIEYRKTFLGKIGHSRGGIRFNRDEKTNEDYLAFIEFLKNELNSKNYVVLGIDFLEEENQFTKAFEKNNSFRESIPGTVIIYPQIDWIKKFNSKKRYDLTYAEKKNVRVKILSNLDNNQNEITENLVDKLYDLIYFAYSRHKSQFPIPSRETFKRIFANTNFALAYAEYENECIAFNLTLFTPTMRAAERVYAGANDVSLKLRVPSLIEVYMVDYLAKKDIKTYDLWGIRRDENDGVGNFKRSIGDKVIYFPEYGILKIKPGVAFLSIFLIKLSKLIKKFI